MSHPATVAPMGRTWTGDVVVVGAGTAGANAAWQLARRGRSVLLVERRPLQDAGADWSNGIAAWQFDLAGVPMPTGDERSGDGSTGTVHLRTPDDTPAVVIEDNPLTGVDMGRFTDRLHSDAIAAGVEIVDDVGSTQTVVRDGRVVAIEAGDGDRRLRAEAALFVDASGWRGVLRQRSEVLRPWCPPVRPDERCSASDALFTVTDPDAARRRYDEWGAVPGDAVNVLGAAGGFSTRSITLSPDAREVRVLVGCLADGRYPMAPRMLASVRAENPWIGDPIHVGTGVIPLRRPFSRFTAPGLALVGDAASQVFPAHGSGVGVGLIGGSTLAEAVDGASDPGAESTIWRYQVEFQRRMGADLTFYDGFRRHTSRMGTEGVRALLRAGLMSAGLARDGLAQRRGTPSPGDVVELARGLARAPRVGLGLAASTARATAAGEVARRYPPAPDVHALERWDRRIARLVRA